MLSVAYPNFIGSVTKWMDPCTVRGAQASEPSVACFPVYLCAVMQIYSDFGWELLFWQSVGCMLWCFPLTRQAVCLKQGLVKILERADNDTVSVVSAEWSCLFFKWWMHSFLLRTLHGNCHSTTFLSVLPWLLTGFTMLNKAKFLIDIEITWRVCFLCVWWGFCCSILFGWFLTVFLSASSAYVVFWLAKDLRWRRFILEKSAWGIHCFKVIWQWNNTF